MKAELLKLVYTFLLSIVAFLAPIHGLMLAVGALIFIDLLLGVLCAKKNNVPIQSKELKRTIGKMFLYQLTILTGFILDLYFIPGNLVVRIAAMAIGLVEAKSIFEHIYTLTGLNVWDLLKDKLQGAITTDTKRIIQEQKDNKNPPAPPANPQ